MTEILVRAQAVSKDYLVGDLVTHALKGASFELATGVSTALTGPSGSGKTTLLHLIAGLDTPSAGDISWPGIGPRESLRPTRVTIAFQSPSLLAALDVAENVALPLILGGATETDAAERATAILEAMSLDDLATKLPEELSGGQSQRVALARALVVRPALLLADEPTGQQDREHAEELLDFVLAFAAQCGTTILVATHDPAVAARMTHSWVLDDGILMTEGPR